MALTNAFFDAVNNENVRRIRIMMKDSLLVDPTFKEFKKMEAAAAKVPGLYDVHDGREFITDESAWNDDYMDKQMVQVVGNFSHERIEHLKTVVRVLRPVAGSAAHTPKAEIAKPANYTGKAQRTEHYSNQSGARPHVYVEKRKSNAPAIVGIGVGVVVGGVVAAAADASIIGGILIGGIVGGIAGVVLSNK